ncbi:MAG: hypothetical protein AAF624_15780, partial [Bacteroidota bacterium]
MMLVRHLIVVLFIAHTSPLSLAQSVEFEPLSSRDLGITFTLDITDGEILACGSDAQRFSLATMSWTTVLPGPLEFGGCSTGTQSWAWGGQRAWAADLGGGAWSTIPLPEFTGNELVRWISDLGDEIYLSTEIEDGLDGSDGRLYRSERPALAWMLVSEGPSGFLPRAVSNIRRLRSGRLVGSLSGAFEGLQLAYSDEGGASWFEADATRGYGVIIQYGERFIAAEPWFYEPEFRLMQTTDGATWTQLGDINAHDVVAASDGSLFAISFTELFRSLDGELGIRWLLCG